MVKVQVVYTKACPFCPAAKDLFKDLKKEYKFDYEEIDAMTPKGQEVVSRFNIMSVPTTIIDDKVEFIGVPPREKAIEKIKSR